MKSITCHKYVFILASMLLSCSGGYDQQYDDFSDFNKVNQRNKGWFPKIIYSDAYNIKNTSYLHDGSVFGTFSYCNARHYDSLFTAPALRKINVAKFKQAVKQNNKHIPWWFLNFEDMSDKDYEGIQFAAFYIVRNANKKKVFFVQSRL